jgi:ribosomal protein L25 (general stress protein Ctc)
MKSYYVIFESGKGKAAMICYAEKLSRESIELWRNDFMQKHRTPSCLISFIQELESEE